MYPSILVKGTIVRIGKQHSISPRALGLEFELLDDVEIDPMSGRSNGAASSSRIVRDVNWWNQHSVKHNIDLSVDTALSQTNKGMVSVLEKEL